MTIILRPLPSIKHLQREHRQQDHGGNNHGQAHLPQLRRGRARHSSCTAGLGPELLDSAHVQGPKGGSVPHRG